MDFLALPRRDLQALCKRNDIRANMTNAAMADALRALPKVEGIEEYVKVLQPFAVPQTAVKSVNEEQKPKKQERPLPCGRRATAKSSEPIEPEEDKEKLEEDAKQQSNKEDAQTPGVGRRGASRRARPVPTVPLPPGKAVAEEDGQEDNLKREANRDNAPAPVVGRRGASRRARPSSAVAAPAADSEVAGAEGEQIEEVVVEDLKREATMDDSPALGVGRRGASRRARAAPSVAALAGKLVAEEQRAPIPRGPRVKAKGTSTETIRLDDSDDEQKEDAKPEGEEDAQILGVGRRGGASRRARAAPAVAAPEANAEEEQRAPVPRGRRIKANSTELIRLDDSKEEKKQDTKPEEEKGDAPAIAVGRCGASRRAPAHSEAPATRRSAAASKAKAGYVAVEAVPIRATRQRKPTMKAAAEEKAPRRATRRGAVMRTLLQQEVQDEAQGVFSDAEAVGAPVVSVEAVRIQETRHRKPTMKAEAAAAAKGEEKAPPRATRRGTVMRTVLQPEVQEKPQGVFSGAEEVNTEDCLSCQEEGDVAVDKVLHDSVDDTILLDCSSDISLVKVEKAGNITSEMPENQAAFDDDGDKPNGVVNGDSMSETTVTDEVVQEEKGVLITNEMPQGTAGNDMEDDQFETIFVQADQVVTADMEVNTEDGLSCREEGDVVADKVLHDSVDNTILLDCSSDISWVEVEKEGNITSEMPENQAALDEDGDKRNGVVIGDSMSQATVTDEVVQDEKGVLITDEILQGTAGMHDMEDDQFETVFVQADQVVTADNLPEQVTDCEFTVEVNTSLIVDERQQSTVRIDENVVEDRSETDGVHSNEQIEVVTTDKVPELKLIEDVLVQADQVVTDDNLPDQVTDCEITVEENTAVIVDEKQQSTVTMDEDADEQMEVEVPELTGTNIEVIEEKTPPGVDEKQKSTVAMDTDVANDHFKTDVVHADELMEVATTDEVPELSEIDDEVVQEEKGVLITDETLQGTTGMHDDIENDQFETVTMDEDVVNDNFETDSVRADEQMEVVTIDKVLELTGTNVEDVEEKTPPVVDEKQKSTVTMDKDVVNDHFKTDVVHADELMEVATTDEVPELSEIDDEVVEEMKTPLIVDEKQLSTATMNEDIVDDHFKTHVAHADEQKEVVATEVPEVTETDSEIEEKTPLIVDEKKQSSVTMDGDVVFDHFKTDTAHANEQKEVIGIATEVPDQVTGTDVEVVEEKAVVITEDMPNQGTVPNVTHTMDECLNENRFGTDFGHGNEQKKAITADIEPEVSRAQDGSALKEIALLDDVTESLSKSIITMEPSVCKNSSEKNTAGPMTLLEEKGVKVASESEDLTKLSLGQLRAKLKEKLNAKKNKEAEKRVALARVDENVCRSHVKGQQQNLNLQQH
ncbi:uncharacterized protein [Miscanthus floridulus]|uniref:uncharacterized protein isoform X1 n=1 Tax=Miscanthus floridulus TaxID=154761 RepID=UPI00345B450E